VPDVLNELSRKSDFFKKNRENGGEKLKQGGSETDESSEGCLARLLLPPGGALFF
jgi:hypothetical protein